MSLAAAVLDERIVPVARGLDATSTPPLTGALVAGGLHVIEITVEAAGGIDAIAAVAGGEVNGWCRDHRHHRSGQPCS